MATVDLIFVSLEEWDEVWRRNQFIVDGLIRRHANMRILFVGPERNVSYAVRCGRWDRIWKSSSHLIGSEARVQCYRPLKWLPNSLTLTRRINEWGVRWQLRGKMKAWAMRSPLLWINAHHAGHLAGRMGEAGVVYDVTDDWTVFGSEGERALVRQQDAALCRKADSVIVCSQRLLELKRPLAREAHLIPNGVDYEHYTVANPEVEPRDAVGRDWNSPVLGYVGTIHSERVDVSLLEHLGSALPHATIVLAGPDMLVPAVRERLLRRPNIRLIGPVPYSSVPRVMQSFDVCLVPHVVTPFTESLNPIKLWEYLAVGKPIVSTPVAGFRDFPEVVSLAETPAKFAQACRRVLEGEVQGLREQRQAIARDNSWSHRLDQIDTVLAGVLSRHADRSDLAARGCCPSL